MAKKSIAVIGAGFAASFWVALDKARQERGVSDDGFYEALKDGSSVRESILAKIVDLVAEIASRVKRAVFHAVFNYDEPLETKTASGFNYVNLSLTDKNFTKVVRTGEGDGEAIFVNFGEYIDSSEEAVRRLDAMGLRPGVPKELADVSKAHPKSVALAACFPAVALGDSWRDPRGGRLVAYLDGGALYRKLRLYYCDRGWSDRWWFPAFRK
jgi:hypothetical protein